MTTWYLGLATTGHDPALAIANSNGKIVFAEASERPTQEKRAWGLPADQISHLNAALTDVGANPARDKIIVATTWAKAKVTIPVTLPDILMPAANGEMLRHIHATAQPAAGVPLLRLGYDWSPDNIQRIDHHLCHVIAALYQTPVADGVCVVIDGEGEAGAAAAYDITNRQIKRRWRSWGHGSLGTFYGWLTQACGFDWQKGEEWKVMGLAAFGTARPELIKAMTAMLRIENGRPIFAPDAELLAAQAIITPFCRTPDDPIEKAADLAASGQQAYSLMADQVLNACLPDTPANLILTGGCALNSSYNGTIAHRFNVDQVVVPSAPGDDGNAIGAALQAWMRDTQTSGVPYGGGSPFLGSTPNAARITKIIDHISGATITDCTGGSAEAVSRVLQQGKIIGVMRGRAEFGPRALGNRSILADPRAPDMKDRINRLVKGREAYRPFAPVIPQEHANDWFDHAQDAPYMSFTLPWKPDKAPLVPAVVHQDGTGRLQTVTPQTTPWLHTLVTAFGRDTGVPVVLNTSFNIMGKPIVHTVEDAVAVFMSSGLDCLLLNDTLFEKR